MKSKTPGGAAPPNPKNANYDVSSTERAGRALRALGKAIATERKRRGLSQTELGRLSNTSINFVSQIESGKPTARIDKLLSVLHALGLEFRLQRGRAVISNTEFIGDK